MSNLLTRGIDFLSARLAAATEEVVEYSRPSTEAVIPELPATPGSQAFAVQQGDGTILDYRTYDWLIAAENLDFGAGIVKPEVGGRIAVYRHNRKQTYEVLRENGIKAWEYSDRYDKRIRIHTKLIESE